MKSYLYKIECLTNLHVGSGDVNFSIIDNEVEKDPVTGYPVINASGVKGAVRDYCESRCGVDVSKVFGSVGDAQRMNSGEFKFFEASFLYRPMRTTGSVPYVPVTTIKAVNDYLSKAEAFGCGFGVKPKDPSIAPGYAFATTDDRVSSVEGDKTDNRLEPDDAIKNVLGVDNYAIARSFDNYGLPVIARNALDDETGTSKNLWYEEYVPHGSAFYLIVLTPDKYNREDILNVIPDGAVIQFGANASIGCGYCRLTLLKEGAC
ncbi:MAG: type III-B CRISPR module RAMP protein Cmr4 [Clostridia bacterium]|nr:type III-B CRISPR module RAMP protein Cmr4 [Clostridia bacterium]